MCSYNIEELLLSTYVALHKLFPHVDESAKILPCVVLVGFQLINGNEVIEEEGSRKLLIGSFETPKIEPVTSENELDALRQAIKAAYEDSTTGWTTIKKAYDQYIREEGELNEPNNT